MTVAELIAKLQEFAKHTPDAPVVIYDGDALDHMVDVETVGRFVMYDNDNYFVTLNRPDDGQGVINA